MTREVIRGTKCVFPPLLGHLLGSLSGLTSWLTQKVSGILEASDAPVMTSGRDRGAPLPFVSSQSRTTPHCHGSLGVLSRIVGERLPKLSSVGREGERMAGDQLRLEE